MGEYRKYWSEPMEEELPEAVGRYSGRAGAYGEMGLTREADKNYQRAVDLSRANLVFESGKRDLIRKGEGHVQE